MEMSFFIMPLAQTRLPDGGQACFKRHEFVELSREIIRKLYYITKA